MVPAADPAACCALCCAPKCLTWSWVGSLWTPKTPCHLSPYAPEGSKPSVGNSGGSSPDAPPAPPTPPGPGPAPPDPPGPGKYRVEMSPSGRRQTIWGIGFEIQSDSIGSGNNGMPGGGAIVSDDDPSTTSAPHDLTPDERERLATEMLSGFRYCRIALGLYFRGLTPDQKNTVGRWPSQVGELKQMQDLSGIEGFAPEYWSPPPAWKEPASYYGGGLAGFNATFLDAFGDAVLRDIQYLHTNGFKIAWWGLQNEPNFGRDNLTMAECANETEAAAAENSPKVGLGDSYATCHYTQCDYAKAFAKVAPKIRQAFPGAKVHAQSATGQFGASPIANDDELVKLVDAWTVHYVGADRSRARAANIDDGARGRPIINNEFEYQPGEKLFGTPQSTLNTAQIMLNFFVFANSPAFYWIHALKPIVNKEAAGYSLGYWRPRNDTDNSTFPDLPIGHWVYNPINWHAVSGFAKLMPWDSTRVDVAEDFARADARIMAFVTPEDPEAGGPLHRGVTPGGKVGVVVAYGRDANASFTYRLTFSDGVERTLSGHRFTPDAAGFNVSLGSVVVPAGGEVNITVPPLSIEFWLEW